MATWDRNGLQVLDRAACLALLAQRSLGRIALSVGALPTILPVSYRLVGEQVLLRAGAGTKLDAALHRNVVAFEVDDLDPLGHTGWSVVVTGIARMVPAGEVPDGPTLDHVPGWVAYDDPHLVAIPTDRVEGRRLDPVHRPHRPAPDR